MSTAFIEQEGWLGGATLADASGGTVRHKREAAQLRLHATVVFGSGGTWAVEMLDNERRVMPLSGLFAVRLEPDTFPQSATARTFSDPLSGLPTLTVELAPYHPPVALHLALLTPFDEELFQVLASADPPPFLYRLYPLPDLVRNSPVASEGPGMPQQNAAEYFGMQGMSQSSQSSGQMTL